MGSVVRTQNHYVQQGYLRRWATPGKRLWTYRTLVSRPRVEPWQLLSLRSLAVQEHLYSQFSFGKHSDTVERWLAESVEGPASRVFEAISAEKHLSPEEWNILIRFFGVSLVRTPAYLIRRQREWGSQLPGLMKSALERGTAILGRGEQLSTDHTAEELDVHIESPFDVRVRKNPDGEGGRVEARVLMGRRLWLVEIRRWGTSTYKQLLQMPWTILRAPEGKFWLTSDNPSVLASASALGVFAVGRTEPRRQNYAFPPLSPRHLLYRSNTDKQPAMYSVAHSGHAEFIQTCIAANAYRLVFAPTQSDWVSRLRPRRVNEEAFAHERAEWAKWNEEQSKAEMNLEDDATWPEHV